MYQVKLLPSSQYLSETQSELEDMIQRADQDERDGRDRDESRQRIKEIVNDSNEKTFNQMVSQINNQKKLIQDIKTQNMKYGILITKLDNRLEVQRQEAIEKNKENKGAKKGLMRIKKMYGKRKDSRKNEDRKEECTNQPKGRQ